MHFFEIPEMSYIFDSANNFDGSQTTGSLKFGTFQGYCCMEK